MTPQTLARPLLPRARARLVMPADESAKGRAVCTNMAREGQREAETGSSQATCAAQGPADSPAPEF